VAKIDHLLGIFFAAPGRGRSGSVEFVFFRTLPFDFAHGSTLLTFPKRAEGRAVRLRRCSASLREVEASLSNGGSWLGQAADLLGDDAVPQILSAEAARGSLRSRLSRGRPQGAPLQQGRHGPREFLKSESLSVWGQHHSYSSGC